MFWKIGTTGEIYSLKRQLKESKIIIENLVNGIDNWNESIQKIIGRQPDYKWPALDEARKFLENNQ